MKSTLNKLRSFLDEDLPVVEPRVPFELIFSVLFEAKSKIEDLENKIKILELKINKVDNNRF